jgi:hypothetical protein
MKRARSLTEALRLIDPSRPTDPGLDGRLIADTSYRTDLTGLIASPEDGARMLVLNIIRLAIADMTSVSKEAGARQARQSAIDYFNSPVYYRHLQYLNLRRGRPVIVNRLLGENPVGVGLQSIARN